MAHRNGTNSKVAMVAVVAAAVAAAVAAPGAAARRMHRRTPVVSGGGGLRSTITDDVVYSKYRTAPFAPLNATSYSGVVASTKRNYTAHLGVVQDASLFSIELYPNACKVRQNVTTAAAHLGCQLATNGGYFDFTPAACDYDLIVNGTVVQYVTDKQVGLGMSDKAGAVVIGYVSTSNYSSYGFRSLLSGNGWLVRAGVDYVNSSTEFQPKPWTNGFVTEKAPRTAIGVMNNGALFSMVVDGVETEALGLDLYEFAEILIDAGVYHAINVDGGGSSDAVLNGKVWSRPTCQDTPEPVCERPVTSITCIAYAK